MNHVESSLKIYFTNEYARFRMMNGNRQLNEKKIKKIIEEINNGNDMLRYYPIQVKENGDRLDILDGQHRFFISKQLKRPVHYVIVTAQKTMSDIAKINSNVEKWKADDFINCYVQFDNANYIQLQKFMDTYHINLGTSLKLLATGNPGFSDTGNGTPMDDFHNGQFEVKAYDKAVELAEICRKFEKFPSWKSRAFIIAIHKIIEANLYSINDLVNDFNKRFDMLTSQPDYKKYIYALEQLVNAGKHKRVTLA